MEGGKKTGGGRERGKLDRYQHGLSEIKNRPKLPRSSARGLPFSSASAPPSSFPIAPSEHLLCFQSRPSRLLSLSGSSSSRVLCGTCLYRLFALVPLVWPAQAGRQAGRQMGAKLGSHRVPGASYPRIAKPRVRNNKCPSPGC